MQRFMFRRVEVWLVCLLFVLGLIAALFFSAAALDSGRGNSRFGIVGKVALSVVSVPETIRRMLRDRPPLEAMAQERLKDEPAGWKFAPGASMPPGYLLLSRHDGNLRHHVVELVSLADGKVLHTWAPRAEDLLADAPHTSVFADFTSWNSKRYRLIHPLLLDDGSLIIKDHQSYPMRIDACGKRLWTEDKMVAHHSTEMDADGLLWMPGLIDPPKLEGAEPGYHEEALMHLDLDGKLLSAESLTQVFVEHGMEWAVYNASNTDSDPLHVNDIEPVLTDGPYWKKGDLFISMRHISMVLLYRPSTREILWMKQGPWLAQHDVDILDDHRITLFDNHVYDRGYGARVDGANRIAIYDFATGEVSFPWDAALRGEKVATLSEGLVDQLPDGGFMVEDENSGRIVIFGPDGAFKASFMNRAANGLAYRMGWSRYVPADLGDKALAAIAAAGCK